MSDLNTTDPFAVLGVSPDADEAEVRARYLALVKRYPPDREPEKFREVRAAFEAAGDPLLTARHLLTRPDQHPPEWSTAIEAQRHNPPRLSPSFLLSLGNRNPDEAA